MALERFKSFDAIEDIRQRVLAFGTHRSRKRIALGKHGGGQGSFLNMPQAPSFQQEAAETWVDGQGRQCLSMRGDPLLVHRTQTAEQGQGPRHVVRWRRFKPWEFVNLALTPG